MGKLVELIMHGNKSNEEKTILFPQGDRAMILDFIKIKQRLFHAIHFKKKYDGAALFSDITKQISARVNSRVLVSSAKKTFLGIRSR